MKYYQAYIAPLFWNLSTPKHNSKNIFPCIKYTKVPEFEVTLKLMQWGFRMGSTCIPVADSFWCLAKLIQCFRFKKKKKKKTKGWGQDRTSDCLRMYYDFLEDMAWAESWKILRKAEMETVCTVWCNFMHCEKTGEEHTKINIFLWMNF